MAIRQPSTTSVNLPERPKVPRKTSSSSEDSEPEVDQPEEEFHTDVEEEDVEEAVEYHTDPEDLEQIEDDYDTDPSNASASPKHTDYDAQILPLELLKSKPVGAPASIPLRWDKLTQKEKKAVRDEMGISMRELREEALRTGALQAGIAAQIRRGIRPAEKVAGSRIVKKAKKRKKGGGVVLSGKQKLLEQRNQAAKQSGKGSIQAGRQKKSKG